MNNPNLKAAVSMSDVTAHQRMWLNIFNYDAHGAMRLMTLKVRQRLTVIQRLAFHQEVSGRSELWGCVREVGLNRAEIQNSQAYSFIDKSDARDFHNVNVVDKNATASMKSALLVTSAKDARPLKHVPTSLSLATCFDASHTPPG